MAKREGKWQRDGGRKGTRSSRSSQELPFGPREPFVSRFMRDASLSAPMAFVLIKIHWAPRPTRPPSSSSFYTNINPNTASNSIPQSNFLPGFFQQRPLKKKRGKNPSRRCACSYMAHSCSHWHRHLVPLLVTLLFRLENILAGNFRVTREGKKRSFVTAGCDRVTGF